MHADENKTKHSKKTNFTAVNIGIRIIHRFCFTYISEHRTSEISRESPNSSCNNESTHKIILKNTEHKSDSKVVLNTYNKSKASKDITLCDRAIMLKQRSNHLTCDSIRQISHKYFCWHFFCK